MTPSVTPSVTPSISITPSLTPTKTPTPTPSPSQIASNITLTFSSYGCYTPGQGVFNFTLSSPYSQDITVTSAQVNGFLTAASCTANTVDDGPDIMGVAAGGDAADALISAGLTTGTGLGITGNVIGSGMTRIKFVNSINVKIAGTTYTKANGGSIVIGGTTINIVINNTGCTTYTQNCVSKPLT